jgi:hypothetical protein
VVIGSFSGTVRYIRHQEHTFLSNIRQFVSKLHKYHSKSAVMTDSVRITTVQVRQWGFIEAYVPITRMGAPRQILFPTLRPTHRWKPQKMAKMPFFEAREQVKQTTCFRHSSVNF